MTALVKLLHVTPGSTFRVPGTGRIAILHSATEWSAHITYRGTKATKTFKAKKRSKATGLEETHDIVVPDKAETLNITSNIDVEVLAGPANEPNDADISIEDLL